MRRQIEGRPDAEGMVLTKAVLRAAGRLGLSNRALAGIIGVSEATVSRMGSGAYALAPGEKPFELAALFVRLFRSLDTITDGDEAAARRWLQEEHAVLGAPPVTLLGTVSGLVTVLGYVDARRALA